MPRSGKLPVLNLLTGQKSAFSPRSGESLHRFMWNLARPRGTWVCFATQNFTPIDESWWYTDTAYLEYRKQSNKARKAVRQAKREFEWKIAANINKKLSWCWQTRMTHLEVSQGHQTYYQMFHMLRIVSSCAIVTLSLRSLWYSAQNVRHQKM